MNQYLTLVQVRNNMNLDDTTKISFAATFLTGTAANWWFTRVGSNALPATWNDYETGLVQEFVPFDSTQRARDKLCRLFERTSVSSYLSEFCKIVLTIPGISEGEQIDRFAQWLKPQVRLEVLKSGAQTINDASRIALNVDAALFGAGMYHFHGNCNQGFGPTPMEIGNFEQREKDRKNNACFKCHKAGCRPWKCGKKRGKSASIGNTSVNDGPEDSGNRSEN